MECRQCGGSKFRRVPRALFLQEAVSRLGFAAWQCRGCNKVCVVRHHGLAMMADEGPMPVVRTRAEDGGRVAAQAEPELSREIEFKTVSPSHSYAAPRPVAVP